MNSFFARRYVITGIFITVTLVLLARLFYMQIIDDQYLLTANKNVQRKKIQYPARGVILDRNNKILVENQPVYDIMVTPKEVKPFDTVEFCRLLGIDKPAFDKKFEKAYKYSPVLQSTFMGQIPLNVSASLGERMYEFPGFDLVLRSIRHYPDSIAAQFLGYINEVNDTRIKKSGGYYKPGDYVGITGVESSYETELRGQRGVEYQMVDSRGKPKGKLANGAYDTLAVAGERLKSSLDIRIQKLGEKLMSNKVGSIVAIEPSTGEILCFVSSPTYNPNLMVGGERGKNAAALFQNPYNPFQVRPIQANYRPGSSFKPIDALVAMQEGLITPQTTYTCPGYYISGNRRIRCFNGEQHGTVNLANAIAHSCNGYFDMVFEKLINRNGPKKTDTTFNLWHNSIAKFGLGSKLGVDLPGEKRGLLPNAAFYDKWYKPGGWRSSTIISLGIGQGELDATPLQLANLEAIIANRGYYYKPHLIKAIGDKQIIKPEYTVRNAVGVDSVYFNPVIDGMQSVVEYGTAVGSKIPGIIMCGKTGTADNTHGEPNSVFVAFAPRDNPKIAIAVVVENGGQGARWAAPIASFIVEKYLRDTITARPSGITLDYFENANVMPPPPVKKSAKPDSTKKVQNEKAGKSVALKVSGKQLAKKQSSAKLVAMLPVRKEENE